ncbi:hypothetical protein Ancab_027622 [Ancistrocladus abbreviatus]
MSSSPAVGDSGRTAGQKSTFSQTCNLLSQYLKVKRSLGDLSLEITDNVSETKGASNNDSLRQTTMNLFPQQSGFGSYASCCVGNGPKVGQMTIFYGGQVIVFNDFPTAKAKEIMELASHGSSKNSRNSAASNSNFPKIITDSANLAAPAPKIAPNFGNNLNQDSVQRSAAPLASDLPIARKASLRRFFEKRKDRITARAPYSTGKPTATGSNPGERKAWLGLGKSTIQLPFADSSIC